MKLGAFSISLAVKDIHQSLSFYKKLGFKEVGGNIDENWVILKNHDTVIGLFQGMFEDNILTFNPGWNQEMERLEEFDDVRDIEKALIQAGVRVIKGTTSKEGPDHIIIQDPDGNMMMLDQLR